MRIHNRTCSVCLPKNIQKSKNNWAINSLRNTLYRMRTHYQDVIYQYNELFGSIYHKGLQKNTKVVDK